MTHSCQYTQNDVPTSTGKKEKGRQDRLLIEPGSLLEVEL